MRVRVLGAAAGGGLPQWNCGCEACRGAREGLVPPRSQSSLAVSADGVRWALCNVSPDVRTQLASAPALGPPEGALRGSGVRAVVLTNADLDHAAGLLVLREGGAPAIYCTEAVERALTEGLSVLPVLRAYGSVVVRRIVPGERVELRDREGAPLGLCVDPFAVASKPPPYMLARLTAEANAAAPRDDYAGDTIGLSVFDAAAGEGARRLVYVPGVRELGDEALRAACARASLLLLDGTCFRDDELVSLGVSPKTARVMGHAPLAGEGGSLEFLRGFPAARRVLVHLNNTNPLWLPEGDPRGDEARAALREAGVERGDDGLEFAL